MKLIVWVKIEITDGGVKVTDGSWRMALGDNERMPEGDAVQIIERSLTERTIEATTTTSFPTPAVDSQLSERELQQTYSNTHTQGRRTDGTAGPTTPIHRILDALQQIGISPDSGRALCAKHGAGRLESLLRWMQSKTEPVGNPARLLLACLENNKR